jgi:5-methylcytosine-specific restriction endonuclease McrA
MLMPIKPENKGLYPGQGEWKAIRQAILTRANHACEECGLPNGLKGWRLSGGRFISHAEHRAGVALTEAEERQFARSREMRPQGMRIVLTTAHLDHDPRHNEEKNLRAWCQKCHLSYDADHHRANATRTRALRTRRLPPQEHRGAFC